MLPTREVVVVGAGIAGLAAALELVPSEQPPIDPAVEEALREFVRVRRAELGD